MIRNVSTYDIIFRGLIQSVSNNNIPYKTMSDVMDDINRIIKDLEFIDSTRFLYEKKYEWKGE